MSTVTAHFLVGAPHPNHDGISPRYLLYLHENSRPVLLLTTTKGQVLGTWIPTVNQMIHDAFLMISVQALKAPEVIQELERCAPGVLQKVEKRNFELYGTFSQEQRQGLYALNQEVLGREYGNLKVALSIYKQSSLRGQLPLLKAYEIGLEVCRSTYSRQYSHWQRKVVESGSLDTKG